MSPEAHAGAPRAVPPPLSEIAREWGRIGCVGFGGPPAHIALLRDLVVGRRRWMDPEEFEDAIAATNLLPGPGSTQLAILCGWRVRRAAGALVAAAGFILPGLVAILALAAVFLADAPPDWVRGAGAGAGAAVPAVAVHAAAGLLGPGRARVPEGRQLRWALYILAGLAAAALAGAWVALVLLGCGAAELARRRSGTLAVHAWPVLAAAATGTSGLAALAWVALKVGALSYGGGFVIVPLMHGDVVERHHWLTDARFLDAVALGQVTPGPVVHTVAAVGYGAAGLGGGLLAAAVAFAPSLAFVLLGAGSFDRLRTDPRARAFLDGAGPAAIGAILGSAIPLAAALGEAWQAAVLAAAAVALLAARAGVVPVLLASGMAGALLAVAGAPLPG